MQNPFRSERPIDHFTVRDVFGRPHALGEWANRKPLVVAFLGTECPLSKLYAVRLGELAAEFGPRGAPSSASIANAQDSLSDVAAFTHSKIPFPIFKDIDGSAADRMGAVRNAGGLRPRRRAVRLLRGRIDDQYGVGVRRPAPTQTYLADALNELLDGKPVSRPVIQSVGCRIGREPSRPPVCRRRDLREPDQSAVATPLRRVPPRGPTRPFPADRLPGRRRLVGHDPRSRGRGPNAAVVRRPPPRPFPQRRSPDRRRQGGCCSTGSTTAARRATPLSCRGRRRFPTAGASRTRTDRVHGGATV